MDGSLTPLQFPVAAPPEPGETLAIAPGIRWLRMPLPFALDHINLWLLEDDAGWTIVDTGYATAETKELWERIFAEQLGGLPVTRVIATHYHPDHIGLAGWLTERWQAPLWVSEKEWLFARVMSPGDEDFAPSRRDFARRAGLDPASVELFGEREKSYRRGVPSVPASFQRLADGMTVEIGGREWRVIVGEGHAPELACLYCAEIGVLISSDQVLPKISPNISVQAHEPDGVRSPAFSPRSPSCEHRYHRKPSSCRRTTCHSLGCMRASIHLPHITRRAAPKCSAPARGRRLRYSCCRSCFGGPST